MARKRKTLEQELDRISKNIDFFQAHPKLSEKEKQAHIDRMNKSRQRLIHYNYKKMPTPPHKDNQVYAKKSFAWIDREEHMWNKKTCRFFCKDCNHSQKGDMAKCSSCGSENVVSLTSDARVPRKNASKKKWNNFIKNFVEK